MQINSFKNIEGQHVHTGTCSLNDNRVCDLRKNIHVKNVYNLYRLMYNILPHSILPIHFKVSFQSCFFLRKLYKLMLSLYVLQILIVWQNEEGTSNEIYSEFFYTICYWILLIKCVFRWDQSTYSSAYKIYLYIYFSIKNIFS